MSCTDHPLSIGHQRHLLALARYAIEQECYRHDPDPSDDTLNPRRSPAPSPLPDAEANRLQQPAAGFVTLMLNGKLRGCMGSLEARRSLKDEVIANACSAAFRDPRFPALRLRELANLEIEISILSPLEPLEANSREQLLDTLRPHIDGLLIESGPYHATFLPQVWQQLPEGQAFLQQLLRKAGLNPNHWPADIKASRYQVSHFSEADFA
ncbi:AmmeMemoRadiSam system protein A [Aestuariirhabdus sp. Z084]|uniref:AmmeMemoRadiSam system protein A n=1 Tax=Aestuariirhabdus haliotis TaxID=2918751 RepID=UPI00201B3C6F|nr:AmmeMemoRadiSam system protein A [Aestuariirhabdus haliotis]MCL6417580.1 AmmeMemoRadiSam system protein A [Aestuariirhabdus haliotis]MCL6421516.1 AmmeMemoRadiSam system protein A [Aestuariirhabdus haliotis]